MRPAPEPARGPGLVGVPCDVGDDDVDDVDDHHGEPAKFTPYLTHLRGNKALVTVAEGFYSDPDETAVPGDSLWIRELPRY